MFEELEKINRRPEPFQFYTASDLWTDAHTSKRMLAFHLNGAVDVSSRNAAFIERSVEWIADRFTVGAGVDVVDFGCGPGLYARRLARCGANVTGIDFSPRSIDYAKNAAAGEQLDIRYVKQDYLAFATEQRFDLVLMIMCDFCALSPSQRKGLLGRFHEILKPGGRVLLDVYSLPAFEKRQETATYALNQMDGFWSSDRYYGFTNTFRYEREKVVLDKYTLIEEKRTRTVYNWLQYFAPEALEREFADAGFSVEELTSDVAGAAYDPQSEEFAIIARKEES